MEFVDPETCERHFARLGIGRGGSIPGSRAAARLKRFDFSYQSPLANAHDVAAAIASHQDEATCLLWVHDLVWGDRSLDATPPASWAAYQRWRQRHGEWRPLWAAPGHRFAPDEGDALAEVIAAAIAMGWDALIAWQPNKPVLQLSHDDVVTIYARSQPSVLIARLARLGLKPMRA